MKNFLANAVKGHRIFYRYYRRKGFKRFLKENIFETHGTPKTKAMSVALGVFIGISPLWGLHTVVVLFLASILKLNKMLSYMCTHVSAPPFLPFIIAASLFLGAPFVHGEKNFKHIQLNLAVVKEHLVQYIFGSFILATACSVIFGFGSYFIFKNSKKD